MKSLTKPTVTRAAVVVGLLAAGAIFGPALSPSGPTSALGSDAFKQKPPRLGPMPQNCPAPLRLQKREALVGPMAGFSPFWWIYYGFRDAVDTRAHLSYNPHFRYGWREKAHWLLEPHNSLTVTVRGWNLQTGQRVWFNTGSLQPGEPAKAAKVGVFRASKAAVYPDGWRSWIQSIYVPSAGCYVMFAQWKSGAWIVPFSVGR